MISTVSANCRSLGLQWHKSVKVWRGRHLKLYEVLRRDLADLGDGQPRLHVELLEELQQHLLFLRGVRHRHLPKATTM